MQEAKASYKCMDDNNYNRDACLEYFKTYKECKKMMVSGQLSVCTCTCHMCLYIHCVGVMFRSLRHTVYVSQRCLQRIHFYWYILIHVSMHIFVEFNLEA